MPTPSSLISIPVDLTNPGQFFACCGLLELASRLDEDSLGWFDEGVFQLSTNRSFKMLMDAIRHVEVVNTMTAQNKTRLAELSVMPKKEREKDGLEEEKKELDALRREEPIAFGSPFQLRIDWFHDEFTGGSRFKTWAGQQSVLDIATAMHAGLKHVDNEDGSSLWHLVRGGGLPFNFDSDLGGQGSPIDLGFSSDALAGNETTRIESSCRPAIEILAFIGLQRFRPREIPRQNRFIYVAWQQPLSPAVAAACVCQAFKTENARAYEFRLLYRTKYLKSFLPAIPFQGDDNE
jgi:CRISPR-associated protein Csb3